MMKTQGWLLAGTLCALILGGAVAPRLALADNTAPGAGAAAPGAPADVGKPEKLKDIRRLLELTGAGKQGIAVMGQMMQQFKQMMPNVPARFWDEFQKEASAEDLINMVVPIYDRHLSHAEIKDVIKFYETPTGKKFIAVMPQISQESMDAGRQWGMKLGEKVQTRLREKGYQK